MRDEWRWVGPDGFEYSGGLERLRQALSSGELPGATPVWREGFEIWLPADSVPELRDAVSGGRLPAFALESRPFSPAPELKTPPPVGISADHVVVAPPGQQMVALMPPAQAYVAPAHPTQKRSWILPLVAVVGVLGALLVVGVIALVMSSRQDGPPSGTASASVGAPSSAPAASASEPTREALRCQPSSKQTLFKAVNGKVPLIVSRSPDTSHLMVGFAETRLIAHALVVDSETLSVRVAKNARAPAPIVGVVPIAKGGDVALTIDVEDPRIRFGRTIDGAQPFRIGIGKDGFVRQRGQGAIETLWKGDAEAESTVARVEGSSERGLFVTVRRGGLEGRIHGAWLEADGRARSELGSVITEGKQVGTPAAAVGESSVVLAAAVRESDATSWDVHLGKAASPKLPERLAPLGLPRASSSVQRMSPAIAALSGGRWLLQWTERNGSSYGVRILVLDSELRAMGEPVDVSPPGSDSGQGELWVRDERVVSLYLVKTSTGHELWATRSSCQ